MYPCCYLLSLPIKHSPPVLLYRSGVHHVFTPHRTIQLPHIFTHAFKKTIKKIRRILAPPSYVTFCSPRPHPVQYPAFSSPRNLLLCTPFIMIIAHYLSPLS